MSTRLSDHDIYLLREGSHGRLYEGLGAHLMVHQGQHGAHFAVWAPNARHVSVMGEWNGWNPGPNPLAPRPDSSGVWEGFIAGVQHGFAYKYRIISNDGSEHT